MKHTIIDKSKAKNKTPQFPKDRYGFDVVGDYYRESVVTAVLQNKKKITSPIQSLVIHFYPTPDLIVVPCGIVICFSTNTADNIFLKIIPGKYMFPSFTDDNDSDLLLSKFKEKYGLVEELSWYEILPQAILDYSLLLALNEAESILKKQGIDFSENSKIVIGDPEESRADDLKQQEKYIRRELRNVFKKNKEALTEFASLCYVSPEKQEWLINES